MGVWEVGGGDGVGSGPWLEESSESEASKLITSRRGELQVGNKVGCKYVSM